MQALTTKQLATFLDVTQRTVQRKAKREQWTFTTRKDIGGDRHCYLFAKLPLAIRKQIVAKIITNFSAKTFEFFSTKEALPTSIFDFKQNPYIDIVNSNYAKWETAHTFAYPLDETELNKPYIRYGLVTLAYLYIVQFSLKKIEGYDLFCGAYNAREIAVDERVYKTIKHVSRISLLRWEKCIRLNSLLPIKGQVNSR